VPNVAETLAFDLYGTLVDPIRIWHQLERHVGDAAVRISELWRQKQLEYTFRLTAMEQYQPFDKVTRKALEYALATFEHELSEEQLRVILAEYDHLEAFPDVQPGLDQLRDAGWLMVVLSNGTPRMLSGAVHSAAIGPYFHDLISVDEVQTYKPAPRVYQYAAVRLNQPIEKVRLISSNPFDIMGAAAAGMQVAWINRPGGVFDTLGTTPPLTARTLTELVDRLAET
jgi:2-haloacid dehalogenase